MIPNPPYLRMRTTKQKHEMEQSVNLSCSRCDAYCCSQNLINVCGYDIWKIATGLQVEPAAFIAFADIGGESPYNLRLSSSDKAYCAALYPKQGPDGTPRCIFLMRLPNNQTRCGIYHLRPIACRAYPKALVGERVLIKPWALCQEQDSDATLHDGEYWREELSRHDMEFSIYAYIVARWNNEVVIGQAGDRKLEFRSFLSWLMSIYGRLEQARENIPEDNWPGIWKQWRRYTSNGINPLSLEISRTVGPESWIRWLESIQEVVAESDIENCLINTCFAKNAQEIML
jgi:Fe-S-cluster containining protein